MTMSSMTGFSRVEGSAVADAWVWEVRSVNGRGLDVRFKLPGFLAPFEDGFRKQVKSNFNRGNLSVNLQFEKKPDEETGVIVNTDLARDIIQQFKGLADEGLVAKPTVCGLLGVRGILQTKPVELSADNLHEPLTDSFKNALQALKLARNNEGEGIAVNLGNALDRIEYLLELCSDNPALQLNTIKQRLLQQVQVLSETVPAERLAQEAAVLAIKADINEELDRLRNHVISARELLKSKGSVGRKLEFLSQEFNREVNTLCAKSSNQQLTDAGLEMKTLVEQIREQAANVE
ncbi:MAG: YicC family protein [Robiginitomaculum sp.]|nr:YicC family protein [Robiginitomaculum sp.]